MYVFLTGGASGIGLALTEAFLQRGHKVVAADLDFEGLQALAKERNWPAEQVRVVALDVRDELAWEAALSKAQDFLGGLDVVMNIAGYLKPGWVQEGTAQDVHQHIDVNLKGVIFGTQAAARLMIPKKSGHIINIASMASLAPIPGLGLYSASKFGVRAYSITAGIELRKYKVAVTTLCPDAVQTPMLDIQKGVPQAALTFSGGMILTTEDIVRVVFEKILPKRPLMVSLPKSRAILARFADLIPSLAALLLPGLSKKGMKNQSDQSPKR